MRTTDVGQQFRSIAEVAEQLGVSKKTVWRWIRAGQIQAYMAGGQWRIKDTDLETFLEERSYPKVQPPLSPAKTAEERGAGDLRALRAFIWKLVKRWEETPPETPREIGVLLDAMQSLIEEGAFEKPEEEITTSDMREASEWMDLQMIFEGLERLNKIAETVETNAVAEERRAAFEVIEEKMSA